MSDSTKDAIIHLTFPFMIKLIDRHWLCTQHPWTLNSEHLRIIADELDRLDQEKIKEIQE